MNKFLAVVKREYVQKVRTKFFVIMTILGPFMLALFTVVPGLLLNIKTGETRLVIIDQTENGKLYQSLRAELQAVKRSEIPTAQNQIANGANSNAKSRFEEAGNSMRGAFAVEEVSLKGRPVGDVQRELNARIAREELDGYLILPPDILSNSKSKAVYYGRNIGDVFTRNQIEQRLNDAVRRQRLLKQGVKDQRSMRFPSASS
jgi:ABC-2 type transport system permease protein